MSWLLPSLVAIVAVFGLCLAALRLRRVEKVVLPALRRRTEDQERELRRIRDADDARNLFLAGLSHELRTPLSGITGTIRLLQATGLNSRQREYVRMAAYASTTVLEIVDDMLTFSRIQADKVGMENTVFSLRAVIDDMLSLQTIKAQARNIALVRDVSPDVPDMLLGDCGKLKQILLNLLGNAIKFTDEGSVTVTVEVLQPGAGDRRRHPAAGASASKALGNSPAACAQLAFAVSDTGIGIPADHQDKVFQPFVQGKPGSAGRGGTGLGLAICRRLVQAMGGEIQLESVPGSGTTMRFVMAFELAQTPLAAPADPVPSHTIQGRRSLTVLVIEDDEINRLVCTRYLALSGHHPLAAAEPRQVFQLMAHTPHMPDAILLDMHLAGISGMELLARIRAERAGWRQIPVVAMSADVSGAAQRQAAAGGVDVFLPKPFGASQLEAALDAVVTKRPPVRTLDQETIEGRLDEGFLREEWDSLGADVMLELLNIFRAGAASRLAAMSDAVQRRDWQALAGQAHALQGSAANLGMTRTVRQARALRQAALSDDGGCVPAQIQADVDDLELETHRAADALRAFLLAAAHKDVALATHGDD